MAMLDRVKRDPDYAAEYRQFVEGMAFAGASDIPDFEKAFGPDPLGKSKRKDQGETGRFRKFTREEIAKRGDNLDISWLKDDSVTDHADLPEPEVIAAEIVAQLQTALEEMQGLQEELGGAA